MGTNFAEVSFTLSNDEHLSDVSISSLFGLNGTSSWFTGRMQLRELSAMSLALDHAIFFNLKATISLHSSGPDWSP